MEFGFAARVSSRAQQRLWQHLQSIYRKNEQDAGDIWIASIFPVHPACDNHFLDLSEMSTVTLRKS